MHPTAARHSNASAAARPSFDAHGDELTMAMIMLPANCYAKQTHH
jgi:hypothetical protein